MSPSTSTPGRIQPSTYASLGVRPVINAGGTYTVWSGSRMIDAAVQAACETIRDRMAQMLADEHQCASQDVVFDRNEVRVAGATYSFAEVAQKAYLARITS